MRVQAGPLGLASKARATYLRAAGQVVRVVGSGKLWSAGAGVEAETEMGGVGVGVEAGGETMGCG